MEEKKRIFAYDALKVLAAFLVVFYHTGMLDLGYHEGVYYYPNFTQLIALFTACGVPLFFMVNGALTVRRDYDLKKTLIKSARCLFVGYIWGLLFQGILAIRNHDLSVFSLYNNYYWFMYTLAMLYVVKFLLNKLPKWCRWCVVMVLLIYPFLNNLIWDFTALTGNTYGVHWRRSGLMTLYSVVYLYAGDYLAHNYKRLSKWVIILVGSIGLLLMVIQVIATVNLMHRPFEGGNYCFPTVGALLLSIALFVWGLYWHLKDGRLKRFILFLANNSLGIYMFHMLLLATAATIFPQIREAEYSFSPAIVAVICIVNMAVSACLSQLLMRSKLGFLLKL
ncbi:MAG: acyltransferase [Muribaculaceae bacterium]|nr:acyltransferase [Muribaculaceae bacterium]